MRSAIAFTRVSLPSESCPSAYHRVMVPTRDRDDEAEADHAGRDPQHVAAVQAALDRVMVEEMEVLRLLKDT